MKLNTFLFALGLSALLGLFGCSGRVLDVGTASQSAIAPDDGEPETVPPTDVGAIAGLWVMTRQDGELGVPYPGAVPPMELELTSAGAVFRSQCVRAPGEVATAACTSALTTACIAGTVKVEGDRWRIDLPAIRVGAAPEQGAAVIMSDGTLFVRYINHSYSAGYFRRIGTKNQVGGCPR